MREKERKVGRPKRVDKDTIVAVRPNGKSKLQKDSDRRAVVQLMIDNGGWMSVETISRHFGFDISRVVRSLVNSGWLAIVGEQDV